MLKVDIDGVPLGQKLGSVSHGVSGSGSWLSEIKHTKVCRECDDCLNEKFKECKFKKVRIIKKNKEGKIILDEVK